MDADESQGTRRKDIADIVIDIDRSFRVDIESFDKQLIDLQEGFAHLLLAGDQPAVKPMQKIIQLECYGKGLGAPVCKREQLEVRVELQLPEDLDGLVDRAAQHLLPTTVIGADRSLVFREFLDEVFRSFFEAAALILLFVPLGRTHGGQEPAAFFVVGKDLIIKILGVPVDEDAAEVEDKGIYFHDELMFLQRNHAVGYASCHVYIFINRSAAFSSVSSFFAKQKRTTRSSFPS